MTEMVFFALADPQRREILRRLVDHGPQTTGSLLRGIGASRQAATRHLATLESAGLVRSEKQGREILRSFDPGALAPAEEFMAELARAWDLRLARLQAQHSEDGPIG
jgi:DNA-binding transcriptional ArsR family regulator